MARMLKPVSKVSKVGQQSEMQSPIFLVKAGQRRATTEFFSGQRRNLRAKKNTNMLFGDTEAHG